MKIQVEILGLSTNPASSGAYALILQEAEGSRRLPIIIGATEAQAIALEMEGVKPPRPFTHDLLKIIIESFGSTLTEVYINDLNDGTFYAQIHLDSGAELDARPSDAIALAVRFNCPIYIADEIMDEAAFQPDADDEESSTTTNSTDAEKANDVVSDADAEAAPRTKVLSKFDQLVEKMNKAISAEDYEQAALLRDEINKLNEKSEY